MDKVFWKSKTFWGAVASAVGACLVIIGSYFGKDFQPILQTVGALLQVFGVPFTIYGRTQAQGALKLRK